MGPACVPHPMSPCITHHTYTAHRTRTHLTRVQTSTRSKDIRFMDLSHKSHEKCATANSPHLWVNTLNNITPHAHVHVPLTPALAPQACAGCAPLSRRAASRTRKAAPAAGRRQTRKRRGAWSLAAPPPRPLLPPRLRPSSLPSPRGPACSQPPSWPPTPPPPPRRRRPPLHSPPLITTTAISQPHLP